MKKDSEISRMFKYAGNRHWLTIAGMIFAGISTVLSMIPFVCMGVAKRRIHRSQCFTIFTGTGSFAWME